MALQCLDIDNKGDEPDTVMGEVKGYEISADGKKMLLAKGEDFYILDSDVKGSGLGDAKVLGKAHLDLSRWELSTTPREEFRGIFLDAWRLERDYFYDRQMQGVDWMAMRERYLPAGGSRRGSRRTERCDRADGERAFGAAHVCRRRRRPQAGGSGGPGRLGAELRRDEKAGGYVVEHVYLHDPDLPDAGASVGAAGVLVSEGEVVVSHRRARSAGRAGRARTAARQGGRAGDAAGEVESRRTARRAGEAGEGTATKATCATPSGSTRGA